MYFKLQRWSVFGSIIEVVNHLDMSMMSVCVTLRRLFVLSQLRTIPSFASATSLQFPIRTLCLATMTRSAVINCCTSTTNSVSILWSKHQSLFAVLKSKASWQKIAWQCGFHTTPQRNISPLLWMVIKPLAKFASMMTGR